LTPEERDKVSRLLAFVYVKAGPKLARSRHSAYDVFNHRVRFCAGAATLGRFISRLSNAWGIQSLPMEALEIVEDLEPREDAVLHYLSTEHIPACARGIAIAHQLKEEKANNANAAGRKNRRNVGASDPTTSLWDREDGLDTDAAPDGDLGS